MKSYYQLCILPSSFIIHIDQCHEILDSGGQRIGWWITVRVLVQDKWRPWDTPDDAQHSQSAYADSQTGCQDISLPCRKHSRSVPSTRRRNRPIAVHHSPRVNFRLCRPGPGRARPCISSYAESVLLTVTDRASSLELSPRLKPGGVLFTPGDGGHSAHSDSLVVCQWAGLPARQGSIQVSSSPSRPGPRPAGRGAVPLTRTAPGPGPAA
jgi:hypothetical protein